MTTDDWYRGGEWTPDAQAEFERRLARARGSNRPQYLRIKGLGLRAAGEVEAARALWSRVLDDPDASWVDRAPATEHLADSHRDDDPPLAASLYREVSRLSPTLSGTSGVHHIKLAQLLLDTGTSADHDEVDELLSWWAEHARNPFPSAHFAWTSAAARLAVVRGDNAAARDLARTALDLTAAEAPFPRHPTVGLARPDEVTLAWLGSLAS